MLGVGAAWMLSHHNTHGECTLSCFDNKETRDIDCQLIVAPQYGITRKAPRNQRKKAFLESRKAFLETKKGLFKTRKAFLETKKVLRERRNLKLIEGRKGEDPVVES
jgi:hypothetical protein